MGTVKARELLLYSEKIKESDVRNLFNQILKSTMPFLGFIDFRDFFSPNFINIITKRKINTMQFFARERKGLADMSMLVFPYKVSEPVMLEKEKGSMLPFPKFYFLGGAQDFLSLALKESIVEVDLKIWRVLGKTLGFGTAVNEKGKKSIVVSTSPERFFEVDLEKNPAVYIEILDPIPKRMSVTSQYPVFEETGITVGVDNFDIFQHTLVIGASGTGKSKGLFALIKSIQAKYGSNVRIVMIDPHGEFVRMFPNDYIVDLVHNYIEPLDVGGNKTPLMTQLISQLLSSAIGGDNKYSERVLFYAVHLLSSIDSMNLKNVSLLLTDSSKRAEFVSSVENDEIKRFFDEEFNDIYIHHFNDAILPVLNFVGEYELYLGGDKKKEDLLNLIRKNNVTVISFNPNFFGKRMINFLAGAVINQMYILAITEKLNVPTILVMDEFQRVETKVVKDILSETRKFNLYAYLSMQYLGQMQKEIHDSIVSNIRNIVSFKLNREDATMISSIMEIKIEESFKKARTQTELEESKKEMFVRLHQRECIVRLFDGKKYILPMKLHVVDVARWGYKPSMELSQMDAAHDTNDSDGKPPVAQYGSGQVRPPPQAGNAQGAQAPVHRQSAHSQSAGAQQSSASYNVQYGAEKKPQPPVFKDETKDKEGDEEKEESSRSDEDEEKKPAKFSDELMGMKLEEDSPIRLREDEEPHEEKESEEDIADKEKELALDEDTAYKDAPKDEESSPDEDEPADKGEAPSSEEEMPADEGESPEDENEAPEDEEPAPKSKPRSKHKPIYMPEYEPEAKPAKKASRRSRGEEGSEDEAPAPRRAKRAKEASDEESREERSLLQKEDDEDASLAQKLSRIREKAAARARVHQPEVSMPDEEEAEEKPSPTAKITPSKAKTSAKKPAAKAKPKKK
ncbi:MAG: DUF87 domain-containing protein [Candidatus Micrarchaeota archaeon]|nr:DUF87 domain-containing protein [Candidatus Micrarchaeota archaeon]